jgi:hypothetical protein
VVRVEETTGREAGSAPRPDTNYPAKVWLNGHEWTKRQARREHLRYDALANGFAACPNPAELQEICDRLGPADIQDFFDR